MVFIVEFADGTRLQVRAGSASDARMHAQGKFTDKLIVAVHQAGLLGMSYRHPPSAQTRK